MVMAALALIVAGCGPRPSSTPSGELATALEAARVRNAAVIIDFHAPWCYSCYYMARNVLNGPEWEAVLRRAVVLEQDVDSPQGRALQQQWRVKALPTYLVLDAQGRELGRILGEQTRKDLYARLDALLDRGSTLEALAARVTGRDPESVSAARQVLAAYHARQDGAGALSWYARLSPDAHDALASDMVAAQWLARLRFLDAAQRKDAAACLAWGAEVLRAELGCDRAYELSRFLGCAGSHPQARSLIAAQRAPMQALLDSGVFGSARCADERSVVLTAADMYAALGEREAEQALIERAAADLAQRIGDAVAADRNLADNLRAYLDRLAQLSGDYSRLDAWMLRLIAAWPGDYVYPFRHGRSLLARGKAAEALPYLDQAAAHAYGVNRLQVAEQRVRALQALGRADDARRIAAEALKANGPWFPEEAARLKALIRGAA